MKRNISLLLACISIVFCIASSASAADVTQTDEAPVACVVDILDRIDGVKSTYIPDYTYFVAHSKQEWVGEDNTAGVIGEPCTNRAIENSHGRFGGVWQSHGFALFVFKTIFGTIPSYDYHCNPSSLNEHATVIARYASKCREIRGSTDGEVTQENLRAMFAQAKPGDIIVLAPKGACFLNGSAMVFLRANDAGIQVYQADYTGACAVTETTVPYATLQAYHCISLLRATNYPTEEYLAPLSSAEVTVSQTHYAHNESALISWLPAKYAQRYSVVLTGQTVTKTFENITETTLSCPDLPADTYRVQVIAENDKGTAPSQTDISFTVHPACKVDFLNYDGSLIATQQVAYGSNATTPAVPDRTGYLFAGWDVGLNNITKDTVIRAQYEKRKYTVTFYSVGRTEPYISTEQVYYGDPAPLPSYDAEAFGIDSDCVFAGWHIAYDSEGTDYTKVDGNMTLVATQTWKSEPMPITIQLSKATLLEDGHTYSVSGTVRNTSSTTRAFKLIASLKTAEDKAVKNVIFGEQTLAAGASATIQDTITYSEKITAIEYVAVGIQGDDKTGGAYSSLARVGITAAKTWGQWSAWSDTKQSGHAAYETKTQYRYRNKVYTTSSSSSLSGWTHYNTTYTWSSYSGWSAWQSSYVGASDSVTVQTRTAYLWFYYDCPYCGGHSYYNRHYTWAGGCNNWIPDSYYRTTWGPAYSNGRDFHGTGRNYCDSTDAGRAYCWASGAGAQSQTQYRYATRYPIYTYYFWQWGSWSGWYDYAVSGDEVSTRTLYRHRDEVSLSDPSAGKEDTSGTAFTLSGTLDEVNAANVVLDGRKATVMVYKKTNSDPTEAQLEYVGQITIGAGNTYNMTFKTKDMPTKNTGSFVVSLGIEGCNKLVNVDVIEPENVTHTVRFLVDGETVSSQTVADGTAASLPEPPVKEGYTFVKWSDSLTCVRHDTDVSAMFVPVEYTITFINWEENLIHQQKVCHGQEIPYPKLNAFAGAIDREWKNQYSITVATSNLVVETEPVMHTVTFKDDTQVYSVQSVKHGEAARLPEAIPVSEGKQFAGWTGACSQDYIVRNVTFTPVFVHEQTVATPDAVVTDNEDGTSSVALSCDTEGADIYYVIETHPHNDGIDVMDAEQMEIIAQMSERLDLLHAETVNYFALHDVVIESGSIPVPGASTVVGGASGTMTNNYNFMKQATKYTGEEILLDENQSIIYLAIAEGMNNSAPQIEVRVDEVPDYTAHVTENTLRQYRNSVEGTVRLAVQNGVPVYREGTFTLCLYDERGVMVDLIPLTAVIAPSGTDIVFENINIPTTKVCSTGQIIAWLNDGGVSPILDVTSFEIK